MSGFVHLLCPACDALVRVNRHADPTDPLDDVDFDRAYTALSIHLSYGCAATAAEQTARRFGPT